MPRLTERTPSESPSTALKIVDEILVHLHKKRRQSCKTQRSEPLCCSGLILPNTTEISCQNLKNIIFPILCAKKSNEWLSRECQKPLPCQTLLGLQLHSCQQTECRHSRASSVAHPDRCHWNGYKRLHFITIRSNYMKFSHSISSHGIKLNT